MTDPFTPVHLTVSREPETIAVAVHEDTAEILTGPGLRLIMAERLSQVIDHGYTPTTDLAYHGAELAFAGKSFVDTYIDLELRPDLPPTSPPESWPFDNLFWKEPRAEDRIKALAKGIACLWAELDRVMANEAMSAAIRDAARPLIQSDVQIPMDCWTLDPRTGEEMRRCGICGQTDRFNLPSSFDARTIPPCSKCHPKGGNHE